MASFQRGSTTRRRSLPSHTEAVLVAEVTPSASFAHLIFVLPLFWQLPGNREAEQLVR